jgi:hypothetical protein
VLAQEAPALANRTRTAMMTMMPFGRQRWDGALSISPPVCPTAANGRYAKASQPALAHDEPTGRGDWTRATGLAEATLESTCRP